MVIFHSKLLVYQRVGYKPGYIAERPGNGGVIFGLKMLKQYWYLQCFVTRPVILEQNIGFTSKGSHMLLQAINI